LQQEGKSIQSKDKLEIVKNANGDIRALLNIAQSWFSGYASASDTTFRIDISLAITNFLKAPTIEAAKNTLINIEGGYSDPRFAQSPEERRKDILSAFFSSIVSSKLKTNEIAGALDILSTCDLLVGKVSERRHWSLLRYLQNMLAYGLFHEIKGKDLTYNQYSYPWQVSAPVLARRLALRKLIANLAARTHTSVSAFGATYLPYLLIMLLQHRVDIPQFLLSLGMDAKAADTLSKEISNLRRKVLELSRT
jgi:hypothetical protein